MKATKKTHKQTRINKTNNKAIKKTVLSPKVVKKISLSQKIANLGKNKIIALLILACLLFSTIIASISVLPKIIASDDSGGTAVLGYINVSKPENVTFYSQGNRNIGIKWTTGFFNNGATKHIVKYKKDLSGATWVSCTLVFLNKTSYYTSPQGWYYEQKAGFIGFKHWFSKSGMASDTRYVISIHAENSAGQSSPEVIIYAKTAK